MKNAIHAGLRVRVWALAIAICAAGSVVDTANAAPVVWDADDGTMTFTKVNFADWTLPGNQDRITDNAWLTRAARSGPLNINIQTEYSNETALSDMEWAFSGQEGNPQFAFGQGASGYESLDFSAFKNAFGWIVKDVVDKPGILHLISDDIYIDIQFSSWTQHRDGGGGFSYERAVPEPATLSLLALGGLAMLRMRRKR